jgi:hypothetical protein
MPCRRSMTSAAGWHDLTPLLIVYPRRQTVPLLDTVSLQPGNMHRAFLIYA